jgi:hypothetical protein
VPELARRTRAARALDIELMFGNFLQPVFGSFCIVLRRDFERRYAYLPLQQRDGDDELVLL